MREKPNISQAMRKQIDLREGKAAVEDELGRTVCFVRRRFFYRASHRLNHRQTVVVGIIEANPLTTAGQERRKFEEFERRRSRRDRQYEKFLQEQSQLNDSDDVPF